MGSNDILRQLRAHLVHAPAVYQRVVNYIAALEADNARLRAALQPLASIPFDDFDGYRGQSDDCPIMIWNEHVLRIGHIREARAALEQKK